MLCMQPRLSNAPRTSVVANFFDSIFTTPIRYFLHNIPHPFAWLKFAVSKLKSPRCICFTEVKAFARVRTQTLDSCFIASHYRVGFYPVTISCLPINQKSQCGVDTRTITPNVPRTSVVANFFDSIFTTPILYFLLNIPHPFAWLKFAVSKLKSPRCICFTEAFARVRTQTLDSCFIASHFSVEFYPVTISWFPINQKSQCGVVTRVISLASSEQSRIYDLYHKR